MSQALISMNLYLGKGVEQILQSLNSTGGCGQGVGDGVAVVAALDVWEGKQLDKAKTAIPAGAA
jgi:hypothetical protein